MIGITLNENQIKTILSVFGELRKRPYEEINTFIGSITIDEMNELYDLLVDSYGKK